MTPDFKKAFMYTAGPIVLLSLLSTAGMTVLGPSYGLDASIALAVLWYVSAGLAIIALLAGLIDMFAREAHDRSAAAGVFAGLGVGILALTVTCFANLAALDRALGH